MNINDILEIKTQTIDNNITLEPTHLANKNPHIRDKNIVFQDEGHIYTLTHKNVDHHPISVTTLIHKFFPHFDADKVIDKMMNGKKWDKSPYFGKTRQEIKNEWSNSGKEASHLGTLMHADIERYFNNIKPIDDNTKEFKYFLSFWENFQHVNPGWEPYRTEWVVYDEDKLLAGSIDFTLSKGFDNKEIVLLDWKRSKQIKMNNSYEKGFGPLSHFDNCNYYHYTLQLNIYRHILETKYDKQVMAMYIAVFHPDNENFQIFTINKFDVASIWDEFFINSS